MKVQAIYQKEWLKLKRLLLPLVLAAAAAGAHYGFELSTAYANIEPESMMWYRFAQLEDKPYAYLAPFFLLAAAVLAFGQFLPEAIQNRVRILTHLPVPLDALVRHHLLAGAVALLLVNGVLGGMLAWMTADYYPPEIVRIVIKDCLYWQLPALILYLGLASVIIERGNWQRWGKLFFALVIALLFFKERYSSNDLVLLLVSIWLVLAVYDSFLSVKSLRLPRWIAYGGGLAACALILVIGGQRYQEEIAKEFKKYYIWYSPILNEWLYQKNGAGHDFHYATPTKSYGRFSFEDNLPFVYWKNLEIQGLLPVEVQGELYDRDRIKSARLTLAYNPSYLQTKEAQLYPLFNPLSDKGVIPFPQEILSVKNDRVKVWEAESVKVMEKLTDQINAAFKEAGLQFPITGIWGKTTNMKPFDWGYFIKDSTGALFNMRRGDFQLKVDKLALPEDIGGIQHVRVSENRQKNFYGYVIDSNSRVYLISYPDYTLIPLDLEKFDYRTMSFKLLANPLHYIVRYDDTKTYRATLFDKAYNKLDFIELN